MGTTQANLNSGLIHRADRTDDGFSSRRSLMMILSRWRMLRITAMGIFLQSLSRTLLPGKNIEITDNQKITFSDFKIEKLLGDVKQTGVEHFDHKTDFASQLLGFIALRYAVIFEDIVSSTGMPEGISENLLLPPH